MINQKPPTKQIKQEKAQSADQGDVQATVLTAMKILYSPKILPMFKEGLTGKAEWPVKLATQVAGLLKLVDDKTPQGIPAKAVAPAAMLLLLDMAQFVAQIGGPKLHKRDIQAAMPILKKLLIEIFSKHGKGAKAEQAKRQQAQGQQAPQQVAPQQMPPQQPQPQGGLIAQGA